MAGLNSKQKRAVELLVAEPEKHLNDIAKECGVDYATLWRWRKKPEFQEYEHELCLERFKDLERLAIRKLQENIMKNNQKAVEYALDFAGYKAKDQLDINNGDISICITGENND